MALYSLTRHQRLQVVKQFENCESPIEEAFLKACLLIIDPIYGLTGDDGSGVRGQTEWGLLEVIPQQVYHLDEQEFRLDFFLRLHKGNFVGRVIVECDGHEFHERTKDQACRDKSRDRAFLREGLAVVRFAGREIWNDPHACAVEAIRCAVAESQEIAVA